MLWNKFSYTLCSSRLVKCDAMTYWPTFNNDAMFGLGGQACCVVWVSIWDWRTSTRNRTRFLCRYWQYYEEEALVITLHLWFQLYVYCNNFIVPPSLPPYLHSPPPPHLVGRYIVELVCLIKFYLVWCWHHEICLFIYCLLPYLKYLLWWISVNIFVVILPKTRTLCQVGSICCYC